MVDLTTAESRSARPTTLSLLGVSLIITVLGAAFTYVVLQPTVGFDDANITQAYARHIAQGHGYVYNIGGERVEGSTSLLWTGLNTLGFWLSDHPEKILAIFSFLLTASTVFISTCIARDLCAPEAPVAPYGAAAVFLLFPGFFGWMVWSLMDMVLWIFLITWLVYLLNRRLSDCDASRSLTWVIIVSGLLPVARPEGIAMTTGLALFLLLMPKLVKGSGSRRGLAITVGVSGLASALAATLWRMSYFGYPFPNTFYAKTSSDFLGQLLHGIKYILSYLGESQNALLVTLVSLAIAVIWARGGRFQKVYALIVAYLMIGGGVVYAALGGDHFGSHRFFLYFVSLGSPLVILGLTTLGTSPGRWVSKAFQVAPFILIAAVSGQSFNKTNGQIAVEFAIAEEGRQRGGILNDLPGQPVVGVITAGGMRMGYRGPIQDLLALNWTRMAHAPHDGISPGVANHDGFNQAVFWQSPPDIFVVHRAECPDTWRPLEGFLGLVTDHVAQDSKFREIYHTACYQNLMFHVARSYVDALEASGTDIPFLILEAER